MKQSKPTRPLLLRFTTTRVLDVARGGAASEPYPWRHGTQQDQARSDTFRD